jgi:hypothetical protein
MILEQTDIHWSILSGEEWSAQYLGSLDRHYLVDAVTLSAEGLRS